MKKKITYALMLVLITLITACTSEKKIIYLQNTEVGLTRDITQNSQIVARPGDKISIAVSCSDAQTSALFSLITPKRSLAAGGDNGVSLAGDGSVSVYTINSDGNILFPILGSLHVAGLTREQISTMIRNLLINKQLVKDPVVTTEFVNLHFSVTGEVGRPGEYPINNDRLTILEALSQAGDLTIYGRRDNVKVIREIDGKRTTYLVDLRDDALFNSPVYYLQQNDVIYVEPNGTKIGQSSVNENNWKSVSLWMSIASFLMTVTVLIVK